MRKLVWAMAILIGGLAGYKYWSTRQAQKNAQRISPAGRDANTSTGSEQPASGLMTITLPNNAASYDAPGLETMSVGGQQIVIDPRLSAAAAVMSSLPADKLPDEAVAFVLHGCGSPLSSVSRSILASEDKITTSAIESALAEVAKPAPMNYGFGVGKREDGRFQLVILYAEQSFDISNATRTLTTEQSHTLTLRVPDPRVSGYSMLLSYPNGDVVERNLPGGTTAISFDTGDSPGLLELDLHKIVDGSPIKLMQLPFYVDTSPPTRATFAYGDKANPKTIAEAEELARFLYDETRNEHQLDSQTHDEVLEQVARAHSQDMATNGFTGHRSPRTGLPHQRLKAAGYLFSGSGENIARNDNIWEAHHGLYQSLGHRKNMLSETFTHVGIGVAKGDNGQWYLTQMFAKSIPQLDTDNYPQKLLARINARRSKKNLPGLTLDATLDAIAKDMLADWHDDAETDTVFERGKQSARDRGIDGGVGFQLQSEWDTDGEVAWLDRYRDATRVGIGLRQDRDGKIRIAWVIQ